MARRNTLLRGRCAAEAGELFSFKRIAAQSRGTLCLGLHKAASPPGKQTSYNTAIMRSAEAPRRECAAESRARPVASLTCCVSKDGTELVARCDKQARLHEFDLLLGPVGSVHEQCRSLWLLEARSKQPLSWWSWPSRVLKLSKPSSSFEPIS